MSKYCISIVDGCAGNKYLSSKPSVLISLWQKEMLSKGGSHYILLYRMDRVAKLARSGICQPAKIQELAG